MLDIFGADPFSNRVQFKPNVEDMEEAYKKATFESKVKLVGYFTKTFNLSNPAEAKDYQKLMKELMDGIAKKTHALLHREKQFVSGDDARWLVNLEWCEFKLIKRRVLTIDEKEKHEQPEPDELPKQPDRESNAGEEGGFA